MKKNLLSMAIACLGLAVSSNAQPIMSESFSGATPPALPGGWTMTTSGPGDGWVTRTTTTNFVFGTVPNTGTHTTYAVVDNYAKTGNAPAIITSPVFSLAGTTSPYLSYDYIFYKVRLSAAPNTMEWCWTEFTTNGTTWTLLDSMPALAQGALWKTRFVALPSTASTTCQFRIHYTNNGATLLGVALDEVQVFDQKPVSLKLTTVTPYAGDPGGGFIVNGQNTTFKGSVLNMGSTTITAFDAVYQVGAASPVVNAITGVNIAPFATYNFTCSTPYNVTTLGSQPVKLWTKATGDAYANDDSGSTAVIGVPSMPKKRLLCEEATGSWCGFCVRGMIYMDSLWQDVPDDVNIISVHDNLQGTDAMAGANTTTRAYDSFMAFNISGYPSMLYDRRYEDQPDNAIQYKGLMTANYFGFGEMTVAPTATSTTVGAVVTVKPTIDMAGDYRLAMVVTEDDVHNNASSYAQHNYYGVGGPRNSTPCYGMGYNFNDSAQTIPGSSMYYQFVARYTVPNFRSSPNGVAGSLPATMTAASTYSYTFAPITIAGTWVKSKLRVVVMMIDNNPSSFTYGMVLNSINGNVPNGVTDVKAGVESMRVFPNPATDDAHVAFDLQTAGKVEMAVYDVMGRKVFSTPAEQMSAGGHQINFNTDDLATGVYNVIISTANGTVAEKLSVSK